MNRFYKKINVWFTLPAVALFIIVVLIPFFMGLVYSFTSWRGAYFAGGSLSESFIGLDNYKKVFTNTKFLASLIYTVKFTVVAVLIINMAALALALLTNHILKGAGAFMLQPAQRVPHGGAADVAHLGAELLLVEKLVGTVLTVQDFGFQVLVRLKFQAQLCLGFHLFHLLLLYLRGSFKQKYPAHPQRSTRKQRSGYGRLYP